MGNVCRLDTAGPQGLKLCCATWLACGVGSGPEDGSAAGRVSPQMRKAMASTLAAAQALAGARGRRRALNAEVAGVDEWRAGEVEASGSMSPGGSLGLGPWGKRMRALRLLAEAQASCSGRLGAPCMLSVPAPRLHAPAG